MHIKRIIISYAKKNVALVKHYIRSQHMFILLLGCCNLVATAQTNANFQTQTGIPCIPVLSTAPSASAAGAIYINSTTKIGYRYTGAVWTPICVNPGKIVSPTGRVWMDRNLGAKRVATSSTDYLAYGDLFQWCRGADGHEKINWTSSTAGTAVNGITAVLSGSPTPGHPLYVISTGGNYDWLSTQLSDGSVWWNGSVVGRTNPCPASFHVPTQAEWQAEVNAGISNSTTAYSRLKLPMPGNRYNNDGVVYGASTFGSYWSSTVAGTYAYQMSFSGSIDLSGNGRSRGFSIRCIKDQ